MANEVEIRISGTNASAPAFEGTRREAQQLSRQLGEEGRRAGQQWSEGFTRDAAGRLRDSRGRFASAGQQVTEGVEEPMKGLFERIKSGFAAAGGQAAEFAQTLTQADDPKAAFQRLAMFLTAAPVLAQAAGAAITLGIGGALSGIGLKAAAADVEIRAKFSHMKEGINSDLQELAEPFRATLLRMPGQARQAFDDLAPSIRAAFSEMSPAVADFMDNLSMSFVELGPAIDSVSENFGPLLDVLGDRMPDIMATLGDSIMKISDAADPKALDALIDGFNATVVVGVEVIRFFETLGMTIGMIWDPIKKTGSALKNLIDPVSATESRDLGQSIADVGIAALEAASGVDELKGKLEQLAGDQLSAREATRGFEEAIDSATESAREHGKTLDVNTEAGRANQEALDSIASSALEMQEAVKAAGGDSTEAMARARRQFINTAMGMGQSRQAAERLADRLGLVKRRADAIPKSKRLTVHDNARAVKSDVDFLIGGINRIPRNKTVTVSFRTIGAAALDAARNLLNDIPGAAGGRAHGGIIGAAGGGPRSGLVLVGEQGPELIKAAPGSTVFTAGKTRQMLGEGGGGGVARIELEWVGGNGSDEFLTWLRKNIRVRAGTGSDSVQRALGG